MSTENLSKRSHNINFFTVITTIQSPTKSVNDLFAKLGSSNGQLVIAGDQKGPRDYEIALSAGDHRIHFLSLDDQLTSLFELARKLPVGHYSRKNIGYLHAIAQGADVIYETDDDNAPNENWHIRSEYIKDIRMIEALDYCDSRWINVYRYFSDENIWPRGLPLDEIHRAVPSTVSVNSGKSVWSPIQQGLVNGSPDVDAIWRLVLDRTFDFQNNQSVYLSPGNWCPFNTQSTWWCPVVYPLLYIPSYCSFRMCDIWKSFVAQRCLWELGAGVTFHAPEVVQDRNEHDIMRDFYDEIPGYERNAELKAILSGLQLFPGKEKVSGNLHACYTELIKHDFFPKEELDLLNAWLADLIAIKEFEKA